MKNSFTLTGLVLGSLIVGCVSKPVPPPPPPPLPPVVTPASLESIRNAYMKANPNDKVGLVTQVLESDLFAAVGEVNSKDFAEGSILTFVDADGGFVAHGVVIKSLESEVHVKFDVAGGRAPRVGDLAIRFENRAVPAPK